MARSKMEKMNSNNDNKDHAAAVLQKLSRGFLAKKQFVKEAELRRAHDQQAGVQAPFVPTPQRAVEVFRDQVLIDGDVLCDLGCGDGRVLIGCASKLAKGMGVDIQESPLFKAKENGRDWSKKLVWVQGDFRDPIVSDFLVSEATICFLFLLPEVLSSLASYLVRSMRPGSRIICYTFSFSNLSEAGFKEGTQWLPQRRIEVPGLPPGACALFEYVIDEKLKETLW